MTEKNTGNTVLIVDGGGRASALAEAYALSPHVDRLIAVPGNDLLSWNTHGKPVEIFPGLKTTDVSSIAALAKSRGVDLVDVAQDNAVEAGLVDSLTQAKIETVGPSREAGQIEWDKAWSREFGKLNDLPQPEFFVCKNVREGFAHLDSISDRPWFVKAKGLVAGKGALPAENNVEARKRIEEIQKFGEEFVLEEWMRNDDGIPGREFSAFIISDGENYQPLGVARDHKRLLDGDLGPNTGGMGVMTPLDDLSPNVLGQIDSVFRKTVVGLKAIGRPYKGVLYFGGMVIRQNEEEVVKVVEFNARHGDPEAEALLPGIKSDFFEINRAAAAGDIGNLQIIRDELYRISVAGVSKGYPEDYSNVTGREIFGLEQARKIARVYGAGIRQVGNRFFAHGGRLFHLVGEGKDLKIASEQVYSAMDNVSIEGNNLFFRGDIGR